MSGRWAWVYPAGVVRRTVAVMGRLILVCLVPGLPLAAQAEVSETVEQRHYTAELRNGASLLAALNRASPIRERGRIFHGYTRWFVEWRFHWRDGADGCEISQVSTALRVTVTLPRLRTNDADATARFETYVAALETHEMGHVQVARDAARDIDAGLRTLPPSPTCGALEQAANALGHRRLEAARAVERRYDRDTGHGRTQGAWLAR